MSLLNRTIKVDFSNRSDMEPIKIIQGELKTRIIHFQLTDWGQAVNLTSCAVRAYIMPCGSETGLYEDLTITDAAKGKADYTVSGNTAATAGEGVLQLEVIEPGSPNPVSAAYSKEIPLIVTAKRDFTGAIESSTVFSSLLNALGTLGLYDSRLSTAETDIDNLQTADAQDVKLTGAQTIAGIKTFSSSPVVPAPSGSGDAANKGYVQYASPVGEIKIWPAAAAPSKYLLCDGSAISRTTYADLFSVLGITYGAGNGSTTFNLPNLKGKVIVGQDSSQTEFDMLAETGGEKSHLLTIAEMPEHDHQSTTDVNAQALSNVTTESNAFGASGTSNYRRNNMMSTYKTGKTGGSTAHNNLQPYIVMNYIIRAAA